MLLDKKIQILRKKPTENALGEMEDCWEIHLAPRARKMEKSGRKISKHAVIFRIRYTEDIETGDRVRYCEKDHDIEGIIEIESHELMDIVCAPRPNGNC